jgi:diguanylate cyclase (GGDEF)-like protein
MATRDIADELAERDPLTGAYTRANLKEILQAELERASDPGGEALSLLVLDLDYLKSINDAFGHRRGDEVLVELVARIGVMTRSGDLLFRVGGDEFTLALPATGRREAAEVARRLLDDVRSPQFGGEPALTISLSIGVATFPDEADTLEELMDKADLRAYEAKRRGRGQVVSDETVETGRTFAEDVSARLVERDQALEVLSAWLDRLPEQRRGLLAVSGPRGSGRTRFLAEVAKVARLRGYEVVEETNVESMGGLVERGADSGVILVVDDLAALDEGVMQEIRRLFEGEIAGQVGLAYSMDRQASRSDVLPNAPSESIQLQGLSPQGVRVWLRSLLQWECPPTLVEWLYRETGGLPAYIRKGLAYLVEKGHIEQHESHWITKGDVTQIALREHLGLDLGTRRHNNLPAVPYNFVGRSRETEQVKCLLQDGRLVTITGPGGIGKTHLAVHTASVMLGEFEAGVYFVPLAAIRDAELVAATMAQTLGVAEPGSKSPLEGVKARLRDKEVLLVLDNFEQLLGSSDAASMVSDLLAACPQVKVLVTSREALRVRGERLFDLPPLAVPDVDLTTKLPGAAGLAGYPAVAMFVQCAQAARADFALTDDNAGAVARMCARLDGLPLAIELVAARVKVLSPSEMLARLKGPGDQEALRLLTGGPRDMPDRHRTMRSAIGWSYDLLADEEQEVFTRLGVFAGGFTLDAAEAVVGGDGSTHDNVLEIVSSLLDKSLLKRVSGEGAGEARFAMLETLREYALEKLVEKGEASAVGRRHAEYYLALAERAEPRLVGPEQKEWLGALSNEYDNMRGALAWAQAAGEWEMLAHLASLLWRLWYLQGPVGEGRAWLDNALARPEEVSPPVRARVLQGAGVLARSQGDLARAKERLVEGLALWRDLGDKQGLSNVLNSLGLLAIEQANYEEAQPYLEESAALDRERGDTQRLAVSLNNLGGVAFFRHDYAEATRFYTESLELRRELGDRWGIANSLYNMGEVAQHEGEYERAGALYKESLVLRQEVGDKRGICPCVDGLAAVAAMGGQNELAAVLLGAVDALREVSSAPRTSAAQAEYERVADKVRAETGEDAYARLRDSGRRLGFMEAIGLALSA